jgi:hypothetical protein
MLYDILEQLFHELEQKYLSLKNEFTLCEKDKKEILKEKQTACKCR